MQICLIPYFDYLKKLFGANLLAKKFNITTDTHIIGESELLTLRGKQPIFVNAMANGIHMSRYSAYVDLLFFRYGDLLEGVSCSYPNITLSLS